MRNLELKARCVDQAALARLVARAAAGGARYVRTLGQRDTYFAAPRARLKLREWWREDGGADSPPPALDESPEDGESGPAGAVLIAYARPDDPGSRLSDYLLVPSHEPEPLRAALARACGVRVVVEKRRVLYRYGQTRLHFDTVAGLGAFVELETVLAAGSAGVAEEARAEHERVIRLLELDALPAIAGSYADLLLARQAEA